MKTIQPEIKNYIDKSIAIAANEFSVRTERYMADLRDGFRQEIKMGFEAFADRPTKEQVREIFREEMQPFHAEMLVFREEMRALRLDVNHHEKRLSKLELRRS